MIKLDLTPEMAVNLRNLLDVSVRADGMRAAELALPIDLELRRAAMIVEEGQVLARVKNARRNNKT